MSELALSWRTGLEHMVAGCGDVSFMDDLVVGQWHACERRTGRVLWQRPPHMGGHYVTHVGRTDGVLIGTVQHGLVFSASGGAFAFDAETGVLLWRRFARNPLPNLLGRFVADFRSHVVSVEEGTVRLADGSVWSARDGSEIRREAESPPVVLIRPLSDPKNIAEWGASKMRIDADLWVRKTEGDRFGYEWGRGDEVSWTWSMPEGLSQYTFGYCVSGMVATLGVDHATGGAKVFLVDGSAPSVSVVDLSSPTDVADRSSAEHVWRLSDADGERLLVTARSGDAGVVHCLSFR